jgi:hypothetical protein
MNRQIQDDLRFRSLLTVLKNWLRLSTDVMRSFKVCTPHQTLPGDQMEKDDMGGACRKYGGDDRYMQGLVWKFEGKKPLGRARRGW